MKLKRELWWIAQDGKKAKNHLLEANLRLVVSWPSATRAAACSSST
jgi:DNA-directed RNA polymerase sigma subunit (sigma70/sigma32)